MLPHDEGTHFAIDKTFACPQDKGELFRATVPILCGTPSIAVAAWPTRDADGIGGKQGPPCLPPLSPPIPLVVPPTSSGSLMESVHSPYSDRLNSIFSPHMHLVRSTPTKPNIGRAGRSTRGFARHRCLHPLTPTKSERYSIPLVGTRRSARSRRTPRGKRPMGRQ